MQKINTVLKNMKALGSTSLLLSLHISPENNFDDNQTWLSFVQTLQQICTEANVLGISVHLRHAAKNWWPGGGTLNNTFAFVNLIDSDNLFVLPNTALILHQV
jgi:hypothetical protein